VSEWPAGTLRSYTVFWKVLIVSEFQWQSDRQRGNSVRHLVFRNDRKGTESGSILRFVRLIAHLINWSSSKLWILNMVFCVTSSDITTEDLWSDVWGQKFTQ